MGNTKMQAWWFEEAGAAADVLKSGEMPISEAGADDVVIRMSHSAVNPTDVKRRTDGRELPRFGRIIPNNDGSGVIEAVGSNVDSARIGERVWLFAAQAGRALGTAAEYCVLPSFQAIRLPDNVSLEHGACLGVPAVTAHRGLFADGPIDGKTVLVTGGTGRVGRYAVQMALQAGATVIATAGTDEKVQRLKALGVQHGLNYKTDSQIDVVKSVTQGRGVDVMLDVTFGSNVAEAPALVAPNGVITSYSTDPVMTPALDFNAFMFANILIRPFSIMGMPVEAKANAFTKITELLRDDALTHSVGARFEFSDLIDAPVGVEESTVDGICVVAVNPDVA